MSGDSKRRFAIRLPEEFKKSASEADRLCINAITRMASSHGVSCSSEDILAVFKTRPNLRGKGVLEYSWSWVSRTWSLRFKLGWHSTIARELGVSNLHSVARVIIPHAQSTGENMTFEECIAFATNKFANRQGKKQIKAGELAGETFGAWVVSSKGAYVSDRYDRAQMFVAVRCKLCGYEKEFPAAGLKSGKKGTGGCPRCSSLCRKFRSNSSTHSESSIARRRFKPISQADQPLYKISVGWFTREVGTAEFIENYTDVMGNDEARKIWINIHGEAL